MALSPGNDETGNFETYITAFPGGGAKWQVSVSGGTDPKWRGDGKEVFFLDPADNLTAADVDTSTGVPRFGTPHVRLQAVNVQRQVGTYVVTADGKRFLINSGNAKEGTEPLTLVLNWPSELKK
jgi:eukaryotic-like serine/threonine-protein kinase